jgi:2-keto-4-pentenoate hydratase/2-oxohepta-3-ene-1,7-dioic acid hydratase in catechol pathway
MKLASYLLPEGGASFGIVSGDGIVDLKKRLKIDGLRELLEVGFAKALPYLGDKPDYLLSDITLLPPIPNPHHILGIGFNTHSHMKEASEFFKIELEAPKYPHVFLRSASSQVGHGAAIIAPRGTPTLDYEGEIAIVIGKAGRYISREDAISHVAGIACYNDGSVREYQRHSQQVTSAKNFNASGSFGPWMVTMDEAGPIDQLTLETFVNGELRQKLLMPDLFFDFAQLIEYVSQPFHLQPGDVIVTGSPSGVGGIQGKFLQPGDTLEIKVPTVGVLKNTVAADPTPVS